jgi:hypothetical protein
MADLTKYKPPRRHPGGGPVERYNDMSGAFIEGALNNGFGRPVNIQYDGPVSKNAQEKTALMGGDDLLGALIGHLYGKKQVDRGEDYSFGLPQLGSLLLPGGAGYQVGRGLTHAFRDQPQKTAFVQQLPNMARNAWTQGRNAAVKRFGGQSEHLLELAGLGMLGLPVAHDLVSDPATESPEAHKLKSLTELAGLGVLGISPLQHLRKP